ncbi:MAG: ATP-binding protein [Spirochaetaceae bacterium]|nr:ATP-binding protein [Spirochaetaceae bacterium]
MFKKNKEVTSENMAEVLQNLQLHQVELEQQNEELKRTHIELENARSRYFDLFNLAPVGYITVNKKKVILEANLTAAELLGVSIDSLINQPLTNFVYNSDQDLFYLSYKSLIRTGDRQKCDLRMVRTNGSVIYTRLEIIIVQERKSTNACFITISDITEHKIAISETIESEENVKALQVQLHQKEKMEAIGQFAGGIAHDFNNMLGVITGFSDLCLFTVEKGSKFEFNINQILKAAERAKQMVKQILTFTRKSSSDKSPLYLKPIIHEVIDFLHASLPSTIEIRSDLSTDSKPVLIEPTRIYEIVMNLCTNAAFAMDEKGTLNISLTEELHESEIHCFMNTLHRGMYSVITISDNGCGMDEEVISHIFEPFYTTKAVGLGTGMGLAVVFGIVQSYGGDIIVKSIPGEGSEFKIYLPKTEESINEENNKYEESHFQKGSGNILYVEDEKLLSMVTEEFLTDMGYNVTAFTDSEAALSLFLKEPELFDLVITDQTMPNLTGFDMSQKFLACRKDIPIILCTGNGNNLNEDLIYSSGIKVFLIKPVRLNILIDKIKSLI